MKYAGLILLLIGAGIAYPAKKIAAMIKKEEPSETDVLKFKLIGFGLVIAGTVLVLIDNI